MSLKTHVPFALRTITIAILALTVCRFVDRHLIVKAKASSVQVPADGRVITVLGKVYPVVMDPSDKEPLRLKFRADLPADTVASWTSCPPNDCYRDEWISNVVTPVKIPYRQLRLTRIHTNGQCRTTKEVLAAMASKGLRPATVDEMVAFGNQHREIIFEKRIADLIAAGSEIRESHHDIEKQDQYASLPTLVLRVRDRQPELDMSEHHITRCWKAKQFALVVALNR